MKPNHYNFSGHDLFEVAPYFIDDPVSAYKFNAAKYLWRLGRKGSIEDALADCDKIIDYVRELKKCYEACRAAATALPGRDANGDVVMPHDTDDYIYH